MEEKGSGGSSCAAGSTKYLLAVRGGIPHCSAFGLLLFLVYVNAMPKAVARPKKVVRPHVSIALWVQNLA